MCIRDRYLICTNTDVTISGLKFSNCSQNSKTSKQKATIKQTILDCLGESALSIHPIPMQVNLHKMALFLDHNKTPLFGIYFFKPEGKARINPVHFDRNDNFENLLLLKEMFLKLGNPDWDKTSQ